jgi:hypothetical protein
MKHETCLNRTWWQSKNGEENVTVQVDFETTFLYTLFHLSFKWAHPEGLSIETSNDFGKTWKASI